MTYLILEILGLLLVAALAGLIVGYLLRSVLGKSSRRDREAHEAQVRKLTSERDEALQSARIAESDRSTMASRVKSDADATPISAEEFDRVAADLETRTTELTVARRKLADLQQRFTDLDSIDGELGDANGLARRIPDLERQLADLQVQSNRLRAIQGEVSTAANQHAALPQPDEDTAVRLEDLQQTADADAHTLQDRIDNLRQRIGRLQGVTPPPDQDDLTQIAGVGERVARLLNTQGIFRFEQLGALDEAGIDELDASLGEFTGRIRRDNWVLQARELERRDEPTA